MSSSGGRRGAQNAFCSATVWSQLPGDTRRALQQLSAAEKAPTRHIKYGHWGMDLNAMEQHQIQKGGLAYITARFKVYFVPV